MNYIEIVEKMMKIDDKLFEEMKILLLGMYIDFSIIDNDMVTKEMVCEKLCDYIEKTLIKTNKTFEVLMNYYMDSINELVKEHLPKLSTGKDSKGKEIFEDSRALKYFKRIQQIRKETDFQFVHLEDYSRVILCLYAEIIRKNNCDIYDFDFSFKNVECQTLIYALESEEVKEKKLLAFKLDELKKKFQIHDKYSRDSFVVILMVIMFYYLKDKEVKGDYKLW